MREIDFKKLPEHIAIIMDGNGRWANKRSLPRIFGHKQGVKTVKDIIKASHSLGIKVLTLYAFSTENWKRPEDEISALFQLMLQFIKSEFDEFNENGVNLRVLGDINKFPEDIQKELHRVCTLTKDNQGLKLNVALNYGGRQEIVKACNEILKSGKKQVNEEEFSSFLYTSGLPDPDLLIRTSGEERISNFLLWQLAYSELYITDTLWPDFNKKELEKAIIDFQKRERRFGGV